VASVLNELSFVASMLNELNFYAIDFWFLCFVGSMLNELSFLHIHILLWVLWCNWFWFLLEREWFLCRQAEVDGMCFGESLHTRMVSMVSASLSICMFLCLSCRYKVFAPAKACFYACLADVRFLHILKHVSMPALPL
jgi:hypothetical protein